MTNLPIPAEALEDCGAVLGRRGAGKSNALMCLFEHELDAGHRAVMIDPKGDRWGIRMNPDGSPSRFEIPIIGGDHGDMPLDEDMGEALGRLVAERNMSCLIDLSQLSLGGKQRFMMSFAPALLQHNRAALTLFIEEVDQFANQDIRYQPAMLVHHIANFATLGRQRGIVMWFASQRPAKVNATVRSQADTFIGMKVTSPLDRDAYRDWFKGHGKDAAARVEEEIGRLAPGEALAWVGATEFFDRVQFPMASTFDSGRTPKHGETIAQVTLPTIDLGEIRAALAPKVEEIKPGTIEAMEADMTIERSVGQQQLDALVQEVGELKASLEATRRDRDSWRQTAQILNARISAVRAALEVSETSKSNIDGASVRKDGEVMPAATSTSEAARGARSAVGRGAGPKSGREPSSTGGGSPSPAALAIADLLDRINPARVTWTQAATMTKRKASGGNFNAARKWLRESGRITEDGDLIRSAKDAPAGMTREEAIDLWRSVLSNPAPKMITAFLSLGNLTKEGLGEAIGAQPRGGNFNNGLSQLRRNGLLYEYGSGTMRLAEPLPGEAV